MCVDSNTSSVTTGALLLLAVLGTSCGDGGPDGDIPWDDACENLSDVHCALPWPSDRWLVDDPDRPTGLRLAYEAESFPANRMGALIDPSPFDRLDGYSPSSQLVTAFPEAAALEDHGGPEHIAASLEADFPTVVIDLETGERVAHWIESDARAAAGEPVLFYVRPATRLLPNRRYGVAIRGLRGEESGELFAAPHGFVAMRDGLSTEHPSFEARRPGYETLFGALQTIGVERDELQLAWWFHTESFESAHDDTLAMRADALARLGDQGVGCTIVEVEPDHIGSGTRRILGTITTPYYLDAAAPPASLVRDGAGMPVFQQMREVEFTAIVPNALYDAGADPGRLVVFGHGLFGQGRESVSAAPLAELAVENEVVFAAIDWLGMSNSDLPFLASALGDVSRFYMVGESLQQAMINQISLTRTMLGACAMDDAFAAEADGASVVGAATPWFIGGSQGSILGGTFLTLSPDIERGALIVGGSGFSLMIERSIHYSTFELLLNPAYPRRVDSGLLMALSQHVWDRGESASWLRYTTSGVAELGPKELIYLVAENDAQVSNLTSGRAARLLGIPVLEQSTHRPYGVPVVSSPHTGSVYIALDVGDRDVPRGNLSPRTDDGGHGAVPFTPEGLAMIIEFLETGGVTVPCDGVCDLTVD